MKWPWVSRATHERELAAMTAFQVQITEWYERERAARREVEAAHASYVASVAEMTTRQLEGRIPPKATPKREPDAADTAIDFVAMGDSARRRHLERFAKAERQAGVAPEEIAKRILAGDRHPDDGDENP